MKTLSLTLRSLISLVVLPTLLAGCAGSHSQYAWSHAMSGDYLFAYDRDACEESAGGQASQRFFVCMESLGYYQIDPVSGVPVRPAAGASATPAAVTSAAR